MDPLCPLNAPRYRRQLKATVTTAAWIFAPGWLGALLVFLVTSTGMSRRSVPYPFGIWILGNAVIALLIRGISRAELRAFRGLAVCPPIKAGALHALWGEDGGISHALGQGLRARVCISGALVMGESRAHGN